jgi:hypothetical protein
MYNFVRKSYHLLNDVIMKRTILLFIFSAFLLSMNAQQEVNMKYGKPTDEELRMTVYEPDNSAEAVILCRLTDVVYTIQQSSFLTDYKERFRIKVLKPEGARFAKVVIPYQQQVSINSIGGTKITAMALPKPGGSSDSYFEGEGVSMTEGVFGTDADDIVEDIKAVAINLEGSKVVKTSLNKSDIVRKKIDEHNYQVEFAVPNVKEGTVVDIEYNIHSQLFWQLRDWYAQCEIPVVYAKLDMNIPSYLIFNIEDHGIQRLTHTCTAGSMKFKLVSDPLANPMNISTNHYVYTGRDLKAMPKDDYVWNLKDYCAGITAELKTYRLPGMSEMDFAKTWEQIDELFLGSDPFNLQLNAHSPLHQELQDAHIQDIANQEERAAAVYQLVMKHVKWNGKYDLWPQPTKETLQQGTGDNADINMLLIQSLKDVGLEAAPVLLRSRDLGMMPYNFPSFQKLSTFVVGILPQGGTKFYVDASSTDDYLNVLPPTLLVERARLLLKDKKSQWVNLQKLQKSQTTTMIEATLSADGTYSGTQTTLYKGLAAAKYRQSKGINEYAADATEVVEFNKKGTVLDGKISFNPFNNPPMTSNPFTATNRLIPVEFPCTSSDQVIINITLPEGYVMESEPQQKSFSTPDKGLEGRLFSSYGGGRIQIQYQFNVNKISHPENNYATLHDMYDLFMKFSNEQIVIKKAN